METTFIDEIEQICEEVADSLYKQVIAITETLAPDGRGFGQELKSIDEQLDDYRKIRNDTTSWVSWIQNKALEIGNELQVGGVDQETIASINPVAIAVAFAMDYSSRMEKELEKRLQ